MNNALTQFQSAKMAEYLLTINALQININNPFTWSSGWRSPVYCDNRISLSFPEVRKFITIGFSAFLQEWYPTTEVIAGLATAGIAHGALLAAHLDLPYCYVRSTAKEHGRKNLIEGIVLPGQKVVVIEDLLSTGGSTLEVVKILRAAGAEVIGVLAIFTYGFPLAETAFAAENISFHTLTDYQTMIQIAIDKGLVSSDLYSC